MLNVGILRSVRWVLSKESRVGVPNPGEFLLPRKYSNLMDRHLSAKFWGPSCAARVPAVPRARCASGHGAQVGEL